MVDVDDEHFVRVAEAKRQEGFIRTAQKVKAHCIGCGKAVKWKHLAGGWCRACREVRTMKDLRARDFPPCICPIVCWDCEWQKDGNAGLCGCQVHR